MQGVNTINVANNLINETVFDVILKHRGRLDSLKVLNLSQNPINLDKKALTKMEEVKRLNIFITLWGVEWLNNVIITDDLSYELLRKG